jgi:hypothetical protein
MVALTVEEVERLRALAAPVEQTTPSGGQRFVPMKGMPIVESSPLPSACRWCGIGVDHDDVLPPIGGRGGVIHGATFAECDRCADPVTRGSDLFDVLDRPNVENLDDLWQAVTVCEVAWSATHGPRGSVVSERWAAVRPLRARIIAAARQIAEDRRLRESSILRCQQCQTEVVPGHPFRGPGASDDHGYFCQRCAGPLLRAKDAQDREQQRERFRKLGRRPPEA